MQLAAATSPFPLLAAFGTVTWGERSDAKTRVTGINLAAGIGAWAIGFQAWEGTREKSAATTNSRWDASSFGFTGREHELDSGLVYARARYLNPAVGRFAAPDRLEASVARNGGLVADAGLRPLLRAGGGTISDVPEYLYGANAPTVLADPSGLTVVYVGVGGTAATFSGGVTAGLGMGMGGSPFALAFLGTFGLAQQLAGMINISVTADLGIYPWLAKDSVCDLAGPFIVEGGDFGLMGISLAWEADMGMLTAALAQGTLALPVLGRPVGIVFSIPLLPAGMMPPGGLTVYGTWSWILAGWGCGC